MTEKVACWWRCKAKISYKNGINDGVMDLTTPSVFRQCFVPTMKICNNMKIASKRVKNCFVFFGFIPYFFWTIWWRCS